MSEALRISRTLSVMKSQQLALFGPVDWNSEREAHQLLGGELRRVLAVDDGGDECRAPARADVKAGRRNPE